MLLKEIKSKISRHYTNLSGWRTKRKIVVFESDDWGSIKNALKRKCMRNVLNLVFQLIKQSTNVTIFIKS